MDSHPRIDLSAFPDSPAAEHLRKGFGWLRFSGELERQFTAFHLDRVRSRARVLFAAVPMVLITEWLGLAAAGLIDRETLWLRIVPNIIVLLACNLVVWSSKYQRVYLPGATLVAAILLPLTAYMLPRDAATDGEAQTLQFVLNIVLMTHLLLGLPFYRAVAINTICLIVFVGSALQFGASPALLMAYLSFIPVAAIAAAAIAYSTEYASRKHFLQERLLGEIAARDALTGMQNRGAFDAHLQLVWKQAQRTRESIGVLMIDVDYFKGFNDTLGHQAGDDCLRRIAATLKTHAQRPMDLAARYGGEEFAIVLVQVTPERLLAVGEAVRATIEALGITNPAAPRKVVTVSCGAALVTPVAGRSVHGLVQLADEALYRAKDTGRNRVILNDQDYQSMSTGRFRKGPPLRVVS